MSSALSAGGTFSANTSNIENADQYFSTPDLLDTSADWSWVGWAKFDSFNENNTVFGDWDSTTGILLRYRLSTTEFYAAINNNTVELTATDFGAFSTGTWYFLGVSYNTVDGYKIVINSTVQSFVTTSANNLASRGFTFGKLSPTNATQSVDGSLAYYRVHNATLSTAEFSEYYNSGEPKCYDNLSTGLKSTMVSAWELANHSGSTGTEIEDRHGSNDATNNNTILYTGTGINVEC